jgi:hypothetical protein
VMYFIRLEINAEIEGDPSAPVRPFTPTGV